MKTNLVNFVKVMISTITLIALLVSFNTFLDMLTESSNISNYAAFPFLISVGWITYWINKRMWFTKKKNNFKL